MVPSLVEKGGNEVDRKSLTSVLGPITNDLSSLSKGNELSSRESLYKFNRLSFDFDSGLLGKVDFEIRLLVGERLSLS